MGNRAVVVGIACVAVAALLAGGGLIVAGSDEGADVSAAHPSALATPSVPVVRQGVPRYGDCGAYLHGSVQPVACGDPRADVEVGARRALGDPAAQCPLYDRTTVLATSGGVGSLYICWVPIGGGPDRDEGLPDAVDVLEVPTSEPEWVVGVCGDVHDRHVHAPYACDDDRADGVVAASVADLARCPADTVLALPAETGRVVCWAPR